MSSWNPSADFYLGTMRRHGGLAKATAQRLLMKSLLKGLGCSSGERPGSWRIAAAPGGLGHYEAKKSDLQNADISPVRYARGCRKAAKKAKV